MRTTEFKKKRDLYGEEGVYVSRFLIDFNGIEYTVIYQAWDGIGKQ